MSPSPATTVFCAVWSGDPDRARLIGGHRANLARQSVPVEVIYVFDAGDAPPPGLHARAIVADWPLTIYEAWNLALAAARTPYVMNLNLDDRLNTDAVAVLQEAIEARGAALVGGDWKVCYSQAETDAVGACYPAGDLPFAPDWPPAAGSLTRLGAGAERGTYGPATLWRLSSHVGLPRFPYRMADGQPVRTIGDLLWWNLLGGHAGQTVAGIPTIIGNYHSHPDDQAEFRAGDEHARLMGQPVSLV